MCFHKVWNIDKILLEIYLKMRLFRAIFSKCKAISGLACSQQPHHATSAPSKKLFLPISQMVAFSKVKNEHNNGYHTHKN